MTTFQQTALLLTVIWLVLVGVRFRRSIVALVAGLFAVALYTLVALAYGAVTPAELGLAIPNSWLPTIGFALLWLGLMLAYSPLADRLATRWIAQPPALGAFRAVQQSRGKLLAGIVVAWVLGGILEELVTRGIVVQAVESWSSAWLVAPAAAGVAICVAALGAGIAHLYQGPRAAVIITQLSALFGLLFVLLGHNLWAVMLCHGLYDTIGFVRFANRQSRYSNLDRDEAVSSETGA